MALIKCPECGKDVSDTCDQCIHCGFKLKKDFNQNKTKSLVDEFYSNNNSVDNKSNIAKVESTNEKEVGTANKVIGVISMAVGWLSFFIGLFSSIGGWPYGIAFIIVGIIFVVLGMLSYKGV